MTEHAIRYEDAAEHVTVTGWACKTCHRWYGDNEGSEHLARWCCATDLPCECGGRITRKTWSVCDDCRARTAEEKWAALERRPWNGELPLYSETADRYVFDEDDLADLIADSPDGADLRLLYCKPRLAREVDEDLWADDLPDDWSLDEVPWLAEAVEQLNATIRAHSEPVSWWATNVVAVMPTSQEDGGPADETDVKSRGKR